jgi:hypothetical protein
VGLDRRVAAPEAAVVLAHELPLLPPLLLLITIIIIITPPRRRRRARLKHC